MPMARQSRRSTGVSVVDIVPVERVTQSILMLRGQRCILDADLARLYGVPTKRLNEQVRRNAERFPQDFRFQLTRDEAVTLLKSQFVTSNQSPALRSQIATSNPGRGGRRYQPYAF